MAKILFFCSLSLALIVGPSAVFANAESQKVQADVARARQGLPLSDAHEFWMDVRLIRPGQTEVGRDETIARFIDPGHLGFTFTPVFAMSKEEILDYLEKRPVPVIQGPDDIFVAVDRHHLMLGVLYLQNYTSLKRNPEVLVRVAADWSKHLDGTPVNREEFEKRLLEAELINPFRSDEGRNIPFEDFPRNPLDLRNNTIRSFVWVLRERKLIVKTPIPHWERKWTQFLFNYKFPKDFDFPENVRLPEGINPRKIFREIAKRPRLTKDLLRPAILAFQLIPPSDYPDKTFICSMTAGSL